MNKTAIKNFAIWARNKLLADITYKAGLLGITDREVKNPLPQSTKDVQFFDIGTKKPYSISGEEIKQRDKLVELISSKSKQTDYMTAYKSVVEEVAYTWFNRLIAIRFMEINDYLPSRIRVLSSESANKSEPDLVTNPFDTDLEFTPYEKDCVMQLKHDNQLDQLFRMLFIKQCNAMNAILPALFEKTCDYTELLLNVAFTDQDGVVFHLVNDIQEDDFNVSKEGQVEIIGWMYQYYNTEPKDEVFALLKKNVKITKERIPAATQLFTPDWIVRYMVENSLGRLWLEGHPNEELKDQWKYYMDEAEQESDVQKQLDAIREEYKTIKPEDIKVIDPCMGSAHILVYAFDVLMQIYESQGYSQRDAAKSIVEHNIYGLDIDNRAYQLAYFAVMMKARQYNRRILSGDTNCHVYVIQESNGINREHLKYFGVGMNDIERNIAIDQMQYLLDTFIDAKEYGSILNVDDCDWRLLYLFTGNADLSGQISFVSVGIEDTQNQLRQLIYIAATMAQKYDVVMTNPPYLGIVGGDEKLNFYTKQYYPDSKMDLFAVFIEKCGQMTKNNCYQAMITQHAWMFLYSFEKLRNKLLLIDTVNMAHFGARAFEEIGGEVVQTTSFVLRKSNVADYKSSYARLIDYNSQKSKKEAFLAKLDLHTAKKESFSKIPSMPIAYWVSPTLLRSFEMGSLLGELASPRKGLATTDNNRFLRLWHEISIAKFVFNCKTKEQAIKSMRKWFPLNKGGGFRRWYGNKNYVVNWYDDGREMKDAVIKRYNGGSYTKEIRSEDKYFRDSITWSALTAGTSSFRKSDYGAVFDSAGSSMFPNKNKNYILGLLNTKVVDKILGIINPTLNYGAGSIAAVPIIEKEDKIKIVSEIVDQCVSISQNDWNHFEISWDFSRHPLLIFGVSLKSCLLDGENINVVPNMAYEKKTVGFGEWFVESEMPNNAIIKTSFSMWQEFSERKFNQLKVNEEELNRIFIEIYGLQDELTPEVKDMEVTVRKADLGRDIRSLISYAVGCMFGRYTLEIDGLVYAGGDWDENKYSKFIPGKDNILPITDEEYFKDDIVGLFCKFVKVSYGEVTLEENLEFIANALGNKGNTSREVIRNYFVKDFFKDHCKVYQKRPIYWLFDSGKADGFKALVYMHRYDENTIGNLRIDYLHRMQRVYDREIARMQETIDNSTNAREVTAAEKKKEKLTKQLKESKDYDEKIAHLALARISIDLDDGVKVNYEKVQTCADGEKLEVLAGI
jgi:hypothetical protein